MNSKISTVSQPIEYRLLRHVGKLMALSFLVFFVIGMVGTVSKGIEESRANALLQQTRALGLALNAYAEKHDGQFPPGRSSTEVFQQLIDQGFITEPEMVYFPLHGKIKPTTRHLVPENVCWDVTGNVGHGAPDCLPLVFATGTRVNYISDGKAVKISARATLPSRLVVFYANGWTTSLRPLSKQDEAPHSLASDADHSTTIYGTWASAPDHFAIISGSLDTTGRSYLQLTPEGPIQ